MAGAWDCQEHVDTDLQFRCLCSQFPYQSSSVWVLFFFLSRSYNYFLCPQFDLASILVYEDIKKYMLSHFPKGKLAGSLYSRRVRIVEFLQFNYIPWTSL